MIGPDSAHSPFEAFSLIAAPALLTNATCVLAMGTVNRMLRTRDRMHELFMEARKNPELVTPYMLAQTQRVERQAVLLLQALAAIYVAKGASVETARQYVKRARAAYDVVSRAQLAACGLRDALVSFDEAIPPNG